MDSQSASLSLLLPAPNIFRVRKQNWLLKVTWMNINSWKCHVAPGIIPNKPRLIWKNFFVKKKKEQKKKHKHWSLSKAVKSTGRLISEGLGSGPLVAMIRRMVWYNKSFLDSCLKDAKFGERRKKGTVFSCIQVKSPSIFQTLCCLWTVLFFYDCSTFLSHFSFMKIRNICNHLEWKEWISCVKDHRLSQLV